MIKKKGKRKTQDPCENCFLHKSICICESIPQLNFKTKVVLVIHAKELKRTTNTGRLALKALVNSEMRIRGATHEALELSDLVQDQNYDTLLFYPSDDAVELSSDLLKNFKKPIQLIVPDGNWRQASKVHYRHHELKDVPRVMIGKPNASPYHMRAESTEEGMATLQAIAEALGVTESSEAKEKLLDLYNLKLLKTLRARGTLKK